MARTQVRSSQLEDGGIWRDDLNVSTSGKAVVRKVIQGRGLSFSSTGADAGTGDVTQKTAPSVTSISSNATWSPNADTDDMYVITAQAAAVTTISNPSGTPVDGQKLIIRVKDNGTARALTWSGTQWRASSDLALPTTTIISKTLYMGFMWNAADSKWDLIALLNNFA